MLAHGNAVTPLHSYVGYEGLGHDLGDGRRELHPVAEAQRSDAAQDPSRDFKVVVVGDAGVGKTSLLARACQGAYDPNYKITIGVDFMFKKYKVFDAPVQLTIWDTAGQEKYHALSRSYFKNADAVVVCYDVHETATFDAVKERWLPMLRDAMETAHPPLMFLLGNKVDLPSFVHEAAAASYAQAQQMEFYRASVKDNCIYGPPSATGDRLPVSKMFDRMACLLTERVLLREAGDAAAPPAPAAKIEKVTLSHPVGSPASEEKKSKRPGCCK